VVVIVADAILETRGRPRRLNAPDQPLGDQQAEGVVHRLQRDGADLVPDDLGHGVSRDVRMTCDGPQHGEPLGGDLNTALAKEVSGVGAHN
jgi:hypothetical protein